MGTIEIMVPGAVVPGAVLKEKRDTGCGCIQIGMFGNQKRGVPQ